MSEGTINPDPNAPPDTSYGGKFVVHSINLGDRTRVFYSDGTSEDVPMGRVAPSASSSVHTTERLIDPNQIRIEQMQREQAAADLAEKARQYNESMGYNKAKFNTEISGHDANGAPTLQAGEDVGSVNGQQTLRAQQQYFDQMRQLSEIASNPRNFMQNFFMNRGMTPPNGAGQYGNMPNLRQFLPNFAQQGSMFGLNEFGSPQMSPQMPMGAGSVGNRTMPSFGGPTLDQMNPYMGLGSSGSVGNRTLPNFMSSPPVSQQPGTSSPQAAPPNFQGPQNNPNNPYAGTNYNYGGSPTQADTAMINGVKTWAGGAYSGKPVDQSPANAGDLTPYLQAGQQAGQARMMAMGGQVTMNQPHALINLVTGRIAAIAGEAGQEHAKFDGAALLDPYGTSSTTTPGPGDPMNSQPDPFLGTPNNTGSSSNTAPSASPIGPTAPGGTVPDTTPPSPYDTAPAAPSGSAPTSTPAAPGSSVLTPELLAQAQAAAAAANAANAARNGSAAATAGPTTTPPPANGYLQQNPGLPGAQSVSGGGMNTNINPMTGVPYGFNPIGNTPNFLSGEDTPLSALQRSGAVPPFMSRIFGQNLGDSTQGTNIPQALTLPPDVPIVSRMAYNQMSPSEQQAFMSYVSSYGVTPEDYMAYVDQFSPHGGRAQSPLFGNHALFYAQ